MKITIEIDPVTTTNEPHGLSTRDVSFLSGGPGVPSERLVSVDGVTIVGDSATVPLSAVGSGFAAAYVSGGVLVASRNIASMSHAFTGVFVFGFKNQPSNTAAVMPFATLGTLNGSSSPGMIVADVAVSGGVVTTDVKTYDDAGAAADRSFYVVWQLGL